jgi:YD repeat-containing protein
VVGATSRSTDFVQNTTACGAPTSITLTASVTDSQSGVASVQVRLTATVNNAMTIYAMTYTGSGSNWSRTFTYSQLGDSGYKYEFRATDNSGNVSAWYSNAGWTFSSGQCFI